ncbi:hypothetical protein [Parabacteroides bouchesdurhonensis]|uniref:hypothetical protein n=1 Tax=Parabacteroides bouchesdurhonensis TaxID=1936995 RepID=UPI000C84AC49|nr:hypothetical protein [Parabacteroides bouchesdurhonensis]
MKRLWILILSAVLPAYIMAQQQYMEYNKKGDDAMVRQDYSNAKIWYEEGVSQCDPYSISQLTKIWLKNERMRPSMRSLMNKCLNCLNVMATEDDTTAVSKLIVYYTNGIGTPKSDELATYWQERLDKLQTPVVTNNTQPQDMQATHRERMKFFLGYSYSIESPYGLTVGGVGRRVGWYARFKTNMSFESHEAECNNQELTGSAGKDYYNFTNKKKINSYTATAGLVIKCTSWLYTSVGVGYGDRTVLYEYQTKNAVTGADEQVAWAKNIDATNNGIAADLDFMVKFGAMFVSAGCNTINFKYVDLNAGLGFFF